MRDALEAVLNLARSLPREELPRLTPELVDEPSRVMIQAKLEKACKESLLYLGAKAGGAAKSKGSELF
jgi:hypothetical protein